MHATFRRQVRTGHLGFAVGSNFRLDRSKGHVCRQVGKGVGHLGAAPSHQHLGCTDGIEQLRISFRGARLTGIQRFGYRIALIKRHITDQTRPILTPVPYPRRT